MVHQVREILLSSCERVLHEPQSDGHVLRKN